ncbi:hypothetical protein RD110_04880 [Rhodoferax koreense]|uniref:Flagellar protein FlgN n=1 Tax=Rhodoferax koreensis TaxID=1842727 RepID=A0A1P8JS80_9BURK|nr:hypothetical protein [Rhodoferax koreense]APW36624.1 hypothetical protein RD110_04880 [Rhodoferax koreense]
MAQPIQFDSSLTEVEQLLDQVSASLLAGDARALEAHSQSLRDAMLALSSMAASQKAVLFANPTMQHRVAAVSTRLAQQREGLARRAVVVNRALATVLPQSDAATYAGRGAPAYRNSAARIYANAAT